MENGHHDTIIEYYQNIFESQDRDFRNSNLRKLVVRQLQGGTFLDIGCGTGHMSFMAAKHGHEVMAIDIIPEMVEFTNRLFTRNELHIETRVLDAENLLEIGDRNFDNIVALDVLEHIENDLDVLRNIHALLSPQGTCILVVPTIKSLYGKRDEMMHHKRRYGKNEIIDKLEKTNFEIIDMRYWNIFGVIPYWLFEKVFQKKVPEKMRYHKRSRVSAFLNSTLRFWFNVAENNIRFPIGLSLFIVAKGAKTTEANMA